MKRSISRLQALGLSLLALTAAALPAAAQTYPTRNITLIVPFAAGGPSDAIARLLGQSMSATLKGQIVIENVAGAGGTAGAARVAKAEPDGHTLLIAHVALPAAASLYKSLPYDTLRDFEPLGLVNYGPMVLTTKKDLPVANAGDLFARLKSGTATTLAHAGIGSNAHLCGLLLQQALGAKVTEVAYRGTGPAMNDLVGGQVDALCDQSTNAVPQVQGNTIKAYGVTSKARLDVIASVPTMQEAGLPDFEFVIWHGLYAPKGTPQDVVKTLNQALQVALDDDTIKARFAGVGTQVFGPSERSPQAHQERFRKEVATWKEVINKLGVQKQAE